MDNRTNTIAGWVLGAGIVALGASIVTGEMFSAERPEKMGYPIEGVEVEGEGGEAEQPVAFYLATADAAAGEQTFRKCATCHTINQGGANGLGPNLWGTMGAPLGHVAGYSYSEALRGVGGNWDWDKMNAWLTSPRAFAPGTKMTFAGLSDPQERANLMAYMNSQGSNIPVPPPPAISNPAEAAAENTAMTGAAAKEIGSPQPEEGRVSGEGAPETSGRAEQEKEGQ